MRRPSQHCAPARSPTSTAKLDELGPSSAVARLWPWPWPNCGRSLALPRPPSPDLAGQHNQPGPPVATRELRVGPFFAPAGCHQRCGVLVGTPGAWGAISPQDGDECCVDRQPRSQKQWQPVSNNFQSPIVEGVGSSQVHLLNPHVQRHPCACFPAGTGSRTS